MTPEELPLSDPETRGVREDWLEEHGRNLRWLAWHSASASASASDSDSASASASASDSDSDSASDSASDSDSDSDSDSASDSDSDSDSDSASDSDSDSDSAWHQRLTTQLREIPDMRDGLKIICTPGAYYYNLTQIAWVRRIAGDEYELINARTLRRLSGRAGLAEWATNGPGKDCEVRAMATLPEEVHRLTIRRCLVANVEAWKAACPKPKDWKDATE